MKFKTALGSISRSFRHMFSFGFFSLPSAFLVALILVFVVLFRSTYEYYSWAGFGLASYISFSLLVLVELIFLLLVLQINLQAYRLTKNSCLNISELKKESEKDFPRGDEFYKGTVLHERKGDFVVFSLYFGIIVMTRLFWTIKSLSVVLKESKTNRKKGLSNAYGWRKVYDEGKEKDHVYYPFVIGLKKNN